MNEYSQLFSKITKCADQFQPLIAAIEVTNRCNAQCGYCFIENKVNQQELSITQLHQVINKLSEEDFLCINITGGEPFIRKDIMEILEHLFNSNFFYSSIYSNGTLLECKHFDLLEKYRDQISPFRMTVFSHQDEIHDAYMKIPGALRSIIKNGKELINRGVEVQLALPLLTCNYKTIRNSIDFFNELGFPVGINIMKLITESNQSDEMFSMISQDFLYDGIKNIIDKKSTIKLGDANTDQLCRGIKENIVIDVNGDIHPCSTFRNLKIGSIFEKLPLKEILSKSLEYIKIRNITKTDLHCNECKHFNECTPCLALQHTLMNNFEKPSAYNCNYTKVFEKLANESA